VGNSRFNRSEAAGDDRLQWVETGNLMRIHLSNFENTAVAGAAPTEGLSGTVVRRIALQDWGDNWLLLALDAPLEYHGRSYGQVLIRSRLVGYELGHDTWTSVFVLVLPNPAVLDKSAVDLKDFDMCPGHQRPFRLSRDNQ
jgi:hypothetical protein